MGNVLFSSLFVDMVQKQPISESQVARRLERHPKFRDNSMPGNANVYTPSPKSPLQQPTSRGERNIEAGQTWL